MEEKYIQIQGIKTRYTKSGVGFPVLAIPGLPFSLTMWHYIEPILSKTNSVYCLDLPGFAGKTDSSSKEHSIEFYVKFIDEFVKAMNIEKTNLLGHSMGGLLSLKYAKVYPQKIDKIMVMSPAYFNSDYENKGIRRKYRRKLFSFISKNKTNPWFLDLLKNRAILTYYKYIRYPKLRTVDNNIVEKMYKEISYMDNRSMMELVYDLLNSDFDDEFKTIQNKTLVVAGEKDNLIVPENCKILAKNILPNAEYAIFSNGQHDFAFTQGNRLSNHIVNFFNN